MERITHGSCSCGAVNIKVTGPLRPVIFCHCRQCRKQSGHFVAATNAPEKSISISGSENITWYQSSSTAKRGFCRTCGSALFWKLENDPTMSILAGCLEKPTGLTTEKHIFCSSKGDYYVIADGLPQFAR